MQSTVNETVTPIRNAYPSLLRRPSAVALAGAFPHGARIAEECQRANITIAGVYDGNAALHSQTVCGHAIQPLEGLSELDPAIPIIACTHRLLLIKQAIPSTTAPVVPFPVLHALHPDLFEAHPFYDGLQTDLSENGQHLQQLRHSLADSHSRQVLDAVIAFRSSLDPTPLQPVVEDDEYLSNVLPLTEHEVLVDGGSYTGDTIKSFLKKTEGRYDKILAFEPDTDSYSDLFDSYGEAPNIHCYQAGLYSEKATLRFAVTGREDATFTEVGGIEVPVINLDAVREAQDATLIRLNIEGAEPEALEGALTLLKKQRPKLAIAVYHRADHLWRIPQWIEDNLGNYTLYLRQHDGGLVETVLYAIPNEQLKGE